MRPVRKPALLPTRVFPRDVMARARRDYTVLAENPDDGVLAADALVRLAEGVEAILCAAGDPLHAETIARQDAVVIATDHDAFDYAMILDRAKLVVDTRGRYPASEPKVTRA